MISQVSGKLLAKELDRVELMTAGGVAYTLAIPLGAYEKLPRLGEPCALYTHLVVKEDAWLLYGFATAFERSVFVRVLDAKGVGPALAIGLLSALSAERLVRAIREKDVATLQGAPRVGRKKAEQLILDLAEKMDDLVPGGGRREVGAPSDVGNTGADAIRALVSLGYGQPDAEKAVRAALDGGAELSAPELIRVALTKVTDARR
jgi:holliday junction DNA helicase RuvA